MSRAPDARPTLLLFGSTGQIGWELRRALGTLANVVSVTRSDADLRDGGAIREVIDRVSPAMIVNAAAYTMVDQAEVEHELALRINADAPGIMAEQAERHGALMVHYSTDYVFDGIAREAYREDHRPNPATVYGRSKLAGEERVLSSGASAYVLRVAWVYANRGRNFLRTVRRLAVERDEIGIVADQYGSPTWARTVAEATASLLEIVMSGSGPRPPDGIYHMAAPDFTTWHGFAEAIVSLSTLSGAGRAPKVIPIATRDYPTAASRPAWSVLDSSKLDQCFGIRLPAWKEQLAMCMADEVTSASGAR